MSGEIKALEGKVDGLGKRLDNQEFLNREVMVAVLAALIAGTAKLFGFLPQGLFLRLRGDRRVLLALSGGVDSSTLAFLLHRAIGDQLTCMFIDQGFMRKGEPERLVELFDHQFHIPVQYVNARERFLKQLEGVNRVVYDITSKPPGIIEWE